ncbi:ash family protein, partial [uncultured Actinobacillus sp.]|uniref:ash family protein n=1 Tax=uncultured Actinobacillus sp. TaxID=417616 RepID=UPI0025FC7BB5
MNLNQEHYKQNEKLSQSNHFTSGQIFNKFHNVIAKSITEPGNSNDLQLANTSTPFYYRAFFVRSTRTPKERLERLSMVACNGKGSPFAVFQLSQFSSPLHVTAQTLESLAVALQKLQLELLAMIYLFKAVSRRDLR